MFKVNNKNFTPCSSVSIVNFEHIIAGWVNNDIRKITSRKDVEIPVTQWKVIRRFSILAYRIWLNVTANV